MIAFAINTSCYARVCYHEVHSGQVKGAEAEAHAFETTAKIVLHSGGHERGGVVGWSVLKTQEARTDGQLAANQGVDKTLPRGGIVRVSLQLHMQIELLLHCICVDKLSPADAPFWCFGWVSRVERR